MRADGGGEADRAAGRVPRVADGSDGCQDRAGGAQDAARRSAVLHRARGPIRSDLFERKLYFYPEAARERRSRRRTWRGAEHFYISSLSSRTIVYKGLLIPDQITGFYPDLADERVESAIALVHSRFSTNTFPTWPRAHPYRYLCHNGEINALRGNLNWMRVREGALSSNVFGEDITELFPVIPGGAE
jgi:glutamate synthase (NADPH) large chain